MLCFFGFLYFLIGILGGIYSPFFLFLALLPTGYLFWYRKTDKKAWLLLLLTGLGFLLICLYPKGNLTATEATGIVVSQKENYYLLLTWQGKYYIYAKSNEATLFSIVKVTGSVKELSFTHYESSFNFSEYLKAKGVFCQFSVSSTSYLFHNPIDPETIKDYLFSSCEQDSRIFLSSLLFGDSLSSLESYQTLSELNITSLLSLSGFHLSFALALSEKILGRKYEKIFPWIKGTVSLLFLVASSFRYALIRIFLLSLLQLLSQKTPWKTTYLERISLVAFLLLLFAPYSLLGGSFYYPFPLLFLLAFFPEKKNAKLKSKIQFYLLVVLFTFPLRLYSTPSFSLLSPLIQLLLIPYSHLLFLLSLILIPMPTFGVILNYGVKLFLSISSFSSNYSFSIYTGTPLIIFTILYYLVFIGIMVCKTYHFTLWKKKGYLALTSLILFAFVPDVIPHYEVTFIDVGQGDCTLIRNGYQNFLIDTGGNKTKDLATECLIPYFQKRKIYSLDGVFITHTDYDHYGALSSLCQNFSVANVLYASDFLAQENDTYQFGDFVIKDLNHYVSSTTAEDNNEASAVFQFQILSKKILVMGDAPKEIEAKILAEGIDVDCDILKLGHHGSKTSSGSDFLSACSPSLAIISCGKNNSYGHPHSVTLDTLNTLDIPYRRTDEEGSISISCLF